MYQPLNTKSGAATISANIAAFKTQAGPDGLEVDTSSVTLPGSAFIPQRLYDWLMGLRLLRNIPLSYLTPDSALLPSESIRIFHVDPTWVDRIIDGVFSAANTGTLDIAYSVMMLQLVRSTLDMGLVASAKDQVSDTTWTYADGITGMLIRSDLVRRWPDVIVRAYAGATEATKAVPVLRAEPVSKDVYIALFAGTPGLVELREPHVGVRFGLETDDQKTYKYQTRNPDDGSTTNKPDTTIALKPGRVVPVATIGSDSRTVAIQLMRPPYVQQFLPSVAESRGSENPPLKISFGGIRVANTVGLASRLAELQRMGKS